MRLILLALLAAVLAGAERPAWIDDAGRAAAFPEPRWLSATAEEHVAPGRDRAKCLEIVAASAQAELARSIRVRIEAVAESRALEITGSTGGRFESSFSDQSRSVAGVWLDQRRLETWFDPQAGRAYAVCAIERQVLADGLRARAELALSELAASADQAQALADGGRANPAAQVWSGVLAGVRAISDDLVLAAGMAPAIADAALADHLARQHRRAAEALARLAGRPITSVDDLVWTLTQQLVRGAGEAKPKVLVPAFTVRESRLSSPFGRFAAQALAGQLGTAAGWTVLRLGSTDPVRAAAAACGAEAVVLGAIWEQPDGVRVAVAAHRLKDGGMLAAAEAVLPMAGVTATGLALAPQNAAAALADQQAFRTDEVISGGMRLEVWTSKGDDAPVFVKGERVQIFVRVDRPAYLRLAYHLADGRRALLVDNRYLDESKVNKVYQLPDEFVVDAPFGAETLQGNASTRPFQPLATRLEDGYPIITIPLAVANALTRGLKKAVPTRAEDLAAETRVVVTTVEK